MIQCTNCKKEFTGLEGKEDTCPKCLEKIMRIEIELPFSGFYESYHNHKIDDEIEQHFNYDYEKDEDREMTEFESNAIFMANVNWTAIQNEYCERWTQALADEVELDLKFTEMTSPKYYNFSTDRVFATIPESQAKQIRQEVEAYPDYAESIRERFTSYDGFSSNYSNDSQGEDWTRKDLDQCQWRVILKLWLNNREDWSERELWLTDDFEMCNWGTVNDAIEVIEAYIKEEASKRLEELRVELQAERISTGELAELADLAKYIQPGDTELAEAAGIPEYPEAESESLFKYNAQECQALLREFEDNIASDPDFNYSYGEFENWIREVVQAK